MRAAPVKHAREGTLRGCHIGSTSARAQQCEVGVLVRLEAVLDDGRDLPLRLHIRMAGEAAGVQCER